MSRAMLAVALIVAAGAAQAQPMPNTAPAAPGAAAGAIDANGQPIIGRHDWVRQPGDRPGRQSSGVETNQAAAPAPALRKPAGAGQPGPDGSFRDEYGFRYDSKGNRIDASGRIMPPPVSRP